MFRMLLHSYPLTRRGSSPRESDRTAYKQGAYALTMPERLA